MKFVCDLHLHSKYSRAVSQAMNLSNMAKWAKYKGINVLATSDFTHPFWFEMLKNELEDAGNGLYRLKITPGVGAGGSEKTSGVFQAKSDVHFMLSSEISSIYSQGGKVRRIHNLFFFPSLSSVEKFNKNLISRGCNLRSDGRPIVGINSRDLLEVALSCDERVLVIPAHIWTPWFSLFGSFSGFDSVEECFGDLSEYIYGIETGLSSDPEMNWQISDLENRAIISSSDAHSLEKMGREATIFEAGEVSFGSIYDAIRGPVGENALALGHSLSRDQRSEVNLHDAQVNQNSKIAPSRVTSPHIKQNSGVRIAFTIEFHPEEGKYHFTGHRDCNFSQSPEETKKNGKICPVCKSPLTVGVMHRVGQLKRRDSKAKLEEVNGVKWVKSQDGRPPYVRLVPLLEILAESLGVGSSSKKVMDFYLSLVNVFGSELAVLLKAETGEIAKFSNELVARSIEKVRAGNIVVEPGYDGKYGIVKIWENKDEGQNEQEESQLNLFV